MSTGALRRFRHLLVGAAPRTSPKVDLRILRPHQLHLSQLQMSTGAGRNANGSPGPPGSPNEKPTIIISHGAWHTPACFRRLAASLKALGFPTVCRTHPSCSPDLDFGQNTLYDDAAALHAEVEKHVERGKTVYVLGHSYGGNVLSEGVTAELGFNQRNGREGGVAGVAYLCAFVMPPTEMNSDRFPDAEAETARDVKRKHAEFTYDVETNSTSFTEGKDAFYNDLTSEDQEYWNARLVPMGARALHDVVTRVAWQHFPSMYMYCRLDVTVPLSAQRNMVKSIKAEGANMIMEPVIEAGHSPFLNKPDTVAKHIQDFVYTVEKQRQSKA